MKFRWKILLSIILLLTAAFSVSGYLLIEHSCSVARNREIQSALEENQVIQVTLENEIVNLIARKSFEGTESLGEAGLAVADALGSVAGDFVLVDENRYFYYNTVRFLELDWELLDCTDENTCPYVILKEDGSWYTQTACCMTVNNTRIYIVSRRDITTIYEDRANFLQYFLVVAVVFLAVCSLLVYLLSAWLTLPIQHLNQTAALIASGDYSGRCEVKTEDEIGELGQTFNRMAQTVENHVRELVEEGKRKEDFVANFTHEIKTPLTSIIGYADMIQSQNLPDETRVLAANYIFSEGMRLEKMSMKLFDLFLLNREDPVLHPVYVPEWMEECAASVEPMLQKANITLEILSADIYMQADPDLLKTAFINMIDNSRKASKEGGRIVFAAEEKEEQVLLKVQDFGFGIPEADIQKITQAFYMVDKSRSRQSGGAGLGLALTDLIIRKNGGRLSIESRVGEGTTMTAFLKLASAPDWEEAGEFSEDEQ